MASLDSALFGFERAGADKFGVVIAIKREGRADCKDEEYY